MYETGFDLSALPYDLGDSSAGGINFGDFDFSDPSLSQLGGMDFIIPGMGSGDSEQSARIDQRKFSDWLSQNNFSLKEMGLSGNMADRYLWDNTKQSMIGSPQRINYNEGPAWDLATAFAGSIINPIGGLAAGGPTGGLGAVFGSSPAMSTAINAGVNNALTTAGQGGSFSDALKSGAIAATGSGYTPNIASSLGVSDPYLSSAVNQGVKGAALSEIAGGDWKTGAVSGAVPGLAAYAGSQVMPQNNTMSGGMSYAPGESPLEQRAARMEMFTGQEAPKMSYATQDPGFLATFGMDSPSPQEETKQPLGGNLTEFIQGLIPNTPERWGDLAGGLLSLYSGQRRRRAAKEMMRQFGSNREAYGQQLQRNLMRKDAASGRRSNYGGREVELQARLAELDSRNAPAMAALNEQRYSGLDQMLRAGMRLGGKMGWFDQPPIKPMDISTMQMPSMPQVYGESDYSLDPRRRVRFGG